MTRTRPLNLLLLVVLGGGIAWFLETALAVSGNAIVIPPFTLAVALLLIAVIIIVMALPVRRVSRGVANARIDPFYATRVVLIAKASSLSGALLTGAGFGILAYLLTRSVIPGIGSLSTAGASTVGAILLLAAGLIAEHWCFIPPSDDDANDSRPTPERLT